MKKSNHPRENHHDEEPAFADLDGIRSFKFNSAQPYNHWKRERLGDLVTVHDKVRVPVSELERRKRRGNYPYCGANGVLDHIDGYLFDGDYVLLAEDGGYWEAFADSAYLMHGRFWVNNHAHVLRARPGILDSEYLFNTLNYEDLTPYIHGTTRGKLNQGVMVEIRIPVPPIEEQRAIARMLKAVRMAKDARQRELALERERKGALMEYLFSHGARGEPTKQTEIGQIPESWKVKPLSSVADLVSGGTPSRENADWWMGAIPWASPKDMKRLRLADTQEHVSTEGIENGSRLMPPDTIFIVIRGMILAKDIPISLAEVPMAFNQDMKAISCHADCRSEYLLYALIWRKGGLARHIGTSAHGTRRISTAAVDSLLLPVPQLDEQIEIARILDSCEAKIGALEREIPLHDELFIAILEVLMTGQLSAVALIEEHQSL